MKKNILLVIVTAIIFTGIGAFAAISYQANEIGYGNGTVKDAIDDLYTTANTTVSNLESSNASLTEENETLTTQNASLTNQVASLQNQVNNPNCVKGTFTCTTCIGGIANSGQKIEGINFRPNIFTFYGYASNLGNFSLTYNRSISTNYLYYDDQNFQITTSNNGSQVNTISHIAEYSNGEFYLKNMDASLKNNTYTFIACR